MLPGSISVSVCPSLSVIGDRPFPSPFHDRTHGSGKAGQSTRGRLSYPYPCELKCYQQRRGTLCCSLGLSSPRPFCLFSFFPVGHLNLSGHLPFHSYLHHSLHYYSPSLHFFFESMQWVQRNLVAQRSGASSEIHPSRGSVGASA